MVPDFDAAVELIDWYRARWEIEMFFYVLKNGCRVEALQLGAIEKLKRALAVYMGGGLANRSLDEARSGSRVAV